MKSAEHRSFVCMLPQKFYFGGKFSGERLSCTDAEAEVTEALPTELAEGKACAEGSGSGAAHTSTQLLP